MKDGKLEQNIAQYLADHPQTLDNRKTRALTGYDLGRRAPNNVEAAVAKLTAAGFTLEQKDGYIHLTNALVSPEWVTGGVTGGSCWRSVSAEEMPAWLEEFLETIAPETSFLKFRRLQQKCTRYSYTNDEYYGNSTDYAFQVLTVSDILAALDA
jgi:hypothetical protein